MNKLPTAETFIQQFAAKYKEDGKPVISTMLIEFAKLHVEAALQAAEEIAIEFDSEGNYDNSILDAYPLNQIK